MLSGLTGETLAPGNKIDLTPFIGREYLLQVEATSNGAGTRIATVMPAWNN